jgi:Rrf2 family protein
MQQSAVNSVRAATAVRATTDRSSLMNIGRKVDYAVRALSYLAAQPQRWVVGSKEIAARQDIPTHYMSKIMKDLATAGLVRSHVGCKGGFSLARPAESISVKEVYEAVEKRLSLMECLEDSCCPYDSVCTQISVWERAQNLLVEYLAGVSIGSLADREGLKGRLNGLHN